MVHGRPRQPQTQGSVERANADVENMLRAWMIDNKSSEWARGCCEVQLLKCNTKHRVINRTPYEAMFGPIKNGFASFNLPRDVIVNLNTKEDLENALREAAATQSKCVGQIYKKCNCNATKQQCSTKRCSCFKANVKYGSRCHNSNPCANKDC